MKKLIKRWDFLEEQRSRIVLGNGVRLDPNNYLELETNALGFRTDANLSAKTWLTTPKSSKRWIGFESKHDVPKDDDGNQVTSVGFRLSRNGTEQLFWDGSAWVAAGAGQWNTEAQVSANIATLTLSATHRGLQVIVNLVTTDPNFSPRVHYIKALYDSDIEWMEDIVVRSFKAAFEAGVRPIAEAMGRADGDATITLQLEAAYDVVSIDSVYNVTDDPERLTNIFSAYNPATKVVTMTVSPVAGKNILISFVYKPSVLLMPSQDAVEVAKTPCIYIGDIRATTTRVITSHESVIDKVTGLGWRLAGGKQSDIDVPLNIVASKEKDVHRMSDEIRSFFEKNPVITTVGNDERLSVQIIEEHGSMNVPNGAGSHSARLRATLMNAIFYLAPAEQVTGVKSFELSGDVNFSV